MDKSFVRHMRQVAETGVSMKELGRQGLTAQEVCNLIDFMDLPIDVFDKIELGDVRGLITEKIHIHTGMERQDIAKLLRTHTATEIMTGECIKIMRHREITSYNPSII